MGTGKLAPKKSKKLEGKSQINKRLNLGESELGVGERGLGFGWDHLLLFLSNDFFFYEPQNATERVGFIESM